MDVNQTQYSDYFVINKYIESLCYTPETNYCYMSIKSQLKNKIIKK